MMPTKKKNHYSDCQTPKLQREIRKIKKGNDAERYRLKKTDAKS